MADLLPSTPDLSAAEEADPRVVGVDSDDAEALISALSSETAREVLAALHDDPANPAALADEVDTSLQNVQYHLENLVDAGVVEVVDTVYSEKGREMDVYAPSDAPLVVYAGAEEEASGLRAALSRLVGGVAALAVGSVVVQALVGELPLPFGRTGGGAPVGTDTPTPDVGDDAATGTPEPAPDTPAPTASPAPESTPTPAADATPSPTDVATEPAATPTPTEVADVAATATPTPAAAADAVASLPPGLLFFLGGLTVLLVVLAAGYRG
jgi:DNA-binding transcriptional ArsR family regulator